MRLTAEEPSSRESRRRATATMKKCPCGNVAKLGEEMCGSCQHRAEEMTTEDHLDKLYDLVQEQSDQIDDLLLAKDDLRDRYNYLTERLDDLILGLETRFNNMVP